MCFWLPIHFIVPSHYLNLTLAHNMNLLRNDIRHEDLQRGDHIYSWRPLFTYAHHGIYIGDRKVIHFTGGEGMEARTGTVFDNFLSSSTSWSTSTACRECSGYRRNNNGVLLTCLECFLAGYCLRRYRYGVDELTFSLQVRGGTCTRATEDPVDRVIHRASYLLDNGFGDYNLFQNNCEDFAVYCKTELVVVMDDGSGRVFMGERSRGRSGQVATAWVGLMSLLPYAIDPSPSDIADAVQTYQRNRHSADLGVRGDVVRVAVEDLVRNVFSL